MTFVAWHDNEERVLAPARFINSMFSCPPASPNKLSLEAFIAHCLNRTQLEEAVLTASLVLLQRLHTYNPLHHGSSAHRLFLAAFMISHKQLSDSPFSNESWSVVGGVVQGLSIRQVNLIESELLQFLGWEVVITPEDLLEVERELHNNYSSHYLSSPPLTPVASRLPTSSLSSPSSSTLTTPISHPLVPSLSNSSTSSSNSSSFPSPSSPFTPIPLSPPSGLQTSTASTSIGASDPVDIDDDSSSLLPNAIMEKFLVAHQEGAFARRRSWGGRATTAV